MRRNSNPAALAWAVLGGLFALGITAMFVRELPSIRRELKILRM